MSKIGYKDDELFLLSIEEYEKYKDSIPTVKCFWWLRSPGYDSDHAGFVHSDRRVIDSGNLICYSLDAVRPALHLNTSNLQIGDRLVKYDFPFIVIDDGVAIAEVPIAFRRFDEYSSDYETSEIRKFLKEWAEGREEKKEPEHYILHFIDTEFGGE